MQKYIELSAKIFGMLGIKAEYKTNKGHKFLDVEEMIEIGLLGKDAIGKFKELNKEIKEYNNNIDNNTQK